MTRKQLIDGAIRKAKKRDLFACQICGRGKLTGETSEGAHLIPRNSPQPRFCAFDPDHIVTLCARHHREYDMNKTMKSRALWFLSHGLMKNAELILWFYGEDAIGKTRECILRMCEE